MGQRGLLELNQVYIKKAYEYNYPLTPYNKGIYHAANLILQLISGSNAKFPTNKKSDNQYKNIITKYIRKFHYKPLVFINLYVFNKRLIIHLNHIHILNLNKQINTNINSIKLTKIFITWTM